jgi:hypothetical protein
MGTSLLTWCRNRNLVSTLVQHLEALFVCSHCIQYSLAYFQQAERTGYRYTGNCLTSSSDSQRVRQTRLHSRGISR